MKNNIRMVIDSDCHTIVTLNGERIIENDWDYSYCERPDEVAQVLDMIFKKIKNQVVDFSYIEVNDFDEVFDYEEEDD